MTQYIENKTKFRSRPKRLRNIIKYSAIMSLAALAITNIVFFIYNRQNLKLNVDAITVLLSVVGIILTFGAIYTYSVFYTNVDDEKEKLNNLGINYKNTLEQYIFKLNQANKLFDYSQKLIKFHQLSLLICLSQKFNSQSLEWLAEFKKIIDEYTIFLEELFSDSDNANVAYKMQGNFTDICRGSFYSFESYKLYIEENSSSFFKDVNNSEDQVSYKRKIDLIIKTLNDLRVKDFSKKEEELGVEGENPEHEISIGQAFKNLLCTIKRKLSPL